MINWRIFFLLIFAHSNDLFQCSRMLDFRWNLINLLMFANYSQKSYFISILWSFFLWILRNEWYDQVHSILYPLASLIYAFKEESYEKKTQTFMLSLNNKLFANFEPQVKDLSHCKSFKSITHSFYFHQHITFNFYVFSSKFSYFILFIILIMRKPQAVLKKFMISSILKHILLPYSFPLLLMT